MNCVRFKEMILDSILDECDSEKNTELQKHILTCEGCRLEYEQMQSAIGIMKTETGDELTPFEKLELENRIYRSRLHRLSAGNSKVAYFKRLAAVAAALFFLFLGFSIRSYYPGDSEIEQKPAVDQRIKEFPGGRFLLMAKGKKALAELESVKQLH